MRILVAGIGNVLRGDDGFGIAALRRLEETQPDSVVEFFESGTAGISLVQKLMEGWDALFLLDALDRGGAPGQVYILEPDLISLGKSVPRQEMIDLHQAGPEAVLRLAAAVQALPGRVWIVGCQAVGCDDLGAPLSEPVARAVPLVVERVRGMIKGLREESGCHVGG